MVIVIAAVVEAGAVNMAARIYGRYHVPATKGELVRSIKKLNSNFTWIQLHNMGKTQLYAIYHRIREGQLARTASCGRT